MRVLVLGCGLVGKELARQLRADGHQVVGTTTTPGKVDALKEVCDEVAVLRGKDRDKVHEAARGCDAIAVCAGPAAQKAMTPEQRRATYHDVLVATAESAATAPIDGPVVALSSLSVYGDAANHLDRIDEDAPLTRADDASPMCFQAAEQVYLREAGDRACVLRCSDICGGDDPPIEQKIKMAHQMLKGSVPFEGRALFYRVHVLDVVRAIKHAIDQKLSGVYNLTHAEVPPRNDAFFNAVGALHGLPPLTFRDELKAPGSPVSSDRLLATGFRLEHTVPERMPEAGATAPVTAAPSIDFAARELTCGVRDRLIQHFGLKEHTAADGGPRMMLRAQGGPLEGRPIGEVRVYSGGPVHKLVYSGMTIDDFSMDTHQVFVYTAPDSPVPHLTLDAAISPNTDSQFHVGLDLLPRVDLGASLAYVQAVYGPLTEAFDAASRQSGVLPATTVGPLDRAHRSPWMVAAFTSSRGLKNLDATVDAYVDHWLTLATEGLGEAAQAATAWQDLKERDRRHREALFSPEVNRVWPLLDRLLGAEAGQALRDVLIAPDP